MWREIVATMTGIAMGFMLSPMLGTRWYFLAAIFAAGLIMLYRRRRRNGR